MKSNCLLFSIILILFACTKEKSDDDKITEPVLKVIVYDATSWVTTLNADPAKEATVQIFNESENYQQTTSEAGTACFKGLEEKNSYNIKVDKGDLSNLLQQESINNEIFGLVTDGVFQTQEEIDNQPFYIDFEGHIVYPQNDAQVGDLRLVDANADRIVNNLDKTVGMAFKYKPYKDINNDETVDELDQVNGEYVLADTVEVKIWIGK